MPTTTEVTKKDPQRLLSTPMKNTLKAKKTGHRKEITAMLLSNTQRTTFAGSGTNSETEHEIASTTTSSKVTRNKNKLTNLRRQDDKENTTHKQNQTQTYPRPTTQATNLEVQQHRTCEKKLRYRQHYDNKTTKAATTRTTQTRTSFSRAQLLSARRCLVLASSSSPTALSSDAKHRETNTVRKLQALILGQKKKAITTQRV